MMQAYADTDPPRNDIDALKEPTLLEFGSNTCGICARATPHIAAALAAHPDVAHIRLEDGRNRKLGRTFGVKLWPTLVFLRNGQEVARLVRPTGTAAIERELSGLKAGVKPASGR